MHDVRFLSRIRRGALPGLALVALQACGSSSTSISSVTSPSSVNRCAITMQAVGGPLPADGASAVITVTAARECAWSATVDGAWLTLRSGTNGQGDGTVEFAASANPDPVMRRGAIVANGQRAEISQSAGECGLSLAQSSASFNQSGGSGQVQVRASSGMCSWSAAADAEWVQIRNGSGQGNGVVSFDVPASTGPPRSATINVAGQKFSIIQSEGCTYAINPASHRRPPVGDQRADFHHHDASLPMDCLEQRSVAHAVAGIRNRTSLCLGDGRGDIRQVAHRHGGRRGAAFLRQPVAGLHLRRAAHQLVGRRGRRHGHRQHHREPRVRVERDVQRRVAHHSGTVERHGQRDGDVRGGGDHRPLAIGKRGGCRPDDHHFPDAGMLVRDLA